MAGARFLFAKVRASVRRQKRHRAFAVCTIGLALLCSLSPRGLTAAEPPEAGESASTPAPQGDAKSSPSDAVPLLSLKYLPSETAAFFSIRPQGFFGREELKLLDRLLNINGSDFRNPVPVTKIEQLTMAMLRTNPDRPARENGPGLIFDLVLVRASEPTDWDKKRAAFPYEMKEIEHASKRFYKIPDFPNICFFPADERNYVVAEEWILKRVMEQAAGEPVKLIWDDAWPQVATSSVVFAFDPAFAVESMKQGRELPGFEQLLKDVKSLLATLDADTGMRWRLMLDCPDEKIANSKVQAAKALIGVARLSIKPKPKEDPPADGKKPPPSPSDLLGQLATSAEFSQFERTAIVTMRTDTDVATGMQVITEAVGQFFGTRVTRSGGNFQFARAPQEPVAASVPGGVRNSPAMARRRTTSKENLERVAAALLKHAERTKALPARASLAADGKSLLSWRVHILPDLGYEELYREFHLDEPWDSEHNAKLVAKMPREFGGVPAGKAPAGGNTMVMAIVGPTACFVDQGTKSLSEIADGPATTLLVVETRRNVPWSKPDDVAIGADGKPVGRLGGIHPGGVVFCTADGQGHFLRDATLAAALPALITIGGQEPVDQARLDEE
ncbi:MAG TPA: DUF1559 domain-containing protein [Pirellulales bacterium]|nr:DUF1559 domain-containing protein [Pirellulales bacterium]